MSGARRRWLTQCVEVCTGMLVTAALRADWERVAELLAMRRQLTLDLLTLRPQCPIVAALRESVAEGNVLIDGWLRECYSQRAA